MSLSSLHVLHGLCWTGGLEDGPKWKNMVTFDTRQEDCIIPLPAWLIRRPTPRWGQPLAALSCLRLKVWHSAPTLAATCIVASSDAPETHMETGHADLPLLHIQRPGASSHQTQSHRADPLISGHARLAAKILWQPMPPRKKP